MSSSSTLPSKYFNRLQANRLEAQNSNIGTSDSSVPSYLLSLLLNEATLTKTSDGGTLTFTKDKVESVIEFTERPLKLTKTISIDSFIDLFSPGIAVDNTFSEDPPNGVLVFKEEQKTYQLKTATSDGNGNYTIELLLIDGETHDNLNPVTDIMSFFVDSVTSSSGTTTSSSGTTTSSSGTTTSSSVTTTSSSGTTTSSDNNLSIPNDYFFEKWNKVVGDFDQGLSSYN